MASAFGWRMLFLVCKSFNILQCLQEISLLPYVQIHQRDTNVICSVIHCPSKTKTINFFCDGENLGRNQQPTTIHSGACGPTHGDSSTVSKGDMFVWAVSKSQAWHQKDKYPTQQTSMSSVAPWKHSPAHKSSTQPTIPDSCSPISLFFLYNLWTKFPPPKL